MPGRVIGRLASETDARRGLVAVPFLVLGGVGLASQLVPIGALPFLTPPGALRVRPAGARGHGARSGQRHDHRRAAPDGRRRARSGRFGVPARRLARRRCRHADRLALAVVPHPGGVARPRRAGHPAGVPVRPVRPWPDRQHPRTVGGLARDAAAGRAATTSLLGRQLDERGRWHRQVDGQLDGARRGFHDPLGLELLEAVLGAEPEPLGIVGPVGANADLGP